MSTPDWDRKRGAAPGRPRESRRCGGSRPVRGSERLLGVQPGEGVWCLGVHVGPGLQLRPALRAVGGRQGETIRFVVCTQITQASARTLQEAGRPARREGARLGPSPGEGAQGRCWAAGPARGLPPSLLLRAVPLSLSVTAQWPASVSDRCSADACCVDDGRGLRPEGA